MIVVGLVESRWTRRKTYRELIKYRSS